MFKHIGIGLDGSTNASAAARIATQLARRLDATLHGFHVIDSSFVEGAFITDISGAMGFEPFLNMQAQMRDTLEEFAQIIRGRFEESATDAGVNHHFCTKHAGVVAGLLDAARLVDVLVVGQRGTNARFHPDLLGPTAEVLLRKSPVPVLIVPEPATFPTRPLVAYDGSVKATRVLHHAAELAAQTGLGLTAVTVDSDANRAAARLDEARGYVEPYGITLDTHHIRGDAVEEVLLGLLTTGEYDLLCLGAHGHSRIVELVMGSTSEFLCRRSPVSVLCATQP